jgi:putative sigma-54 modulation protein
MRLDFGVWPGSVCWEMSSVQVKLSARHGQIFDDDRTFLLEKVQKLLHYHDRIEMIEVTVDFQQNPHTQQKRVEILVNAEHKHDIVAHADHEELLTACDAAVEKMKHQLTKYKEKIQDHRRGNSRSEGN